MRLGSTSKPRRLAWIVNHRTLMPAEVPILRSLGWEVFVPKLIPDHDPGYRSAAITYEYDQSLSISPSALAVLNAHNFYTRDWSPTVARIMNDSFDVVVATLSAYVAPLSEAARKFSGLVVARVFGREHPERYSNIPRVTSRPHLLSEFVALGDRFVFGQGYQNLAEIEDEPFHSRGHTITIPLPSFVFTRENSWKGDGSHAVFLCPATTDQGYYQAIYQRDKRDFGDIPHQFFGRQIGPVSDPAVLPYMTDDELFQLYAATPVFVYPSTEPRHVHYSPLEAMVVGTPVLYRAGSLIDALGGSADSPGRCANTEDMRRKVRRLLNGDRAVSEAIRSMQGRILEAFAVDLATEQWRQLFDTKLRRHGVAA